MEYGFEIKGVDAVMAAIKAKAVKADLGVKLAASAMGAELESAMKLQIKGRHKPGTSRTDADPRTGRGPGGVPPQNVTNQLRNTITYGVSQIGFGTYKVVAGPTKVYARSLELGNPRWRSDTRYPFVEPAYREVLSSGRLTAIWQQTMRRFI
jgi:hypothetical protein